MALRVTRLPQDLRRLNDFISKTDHAQRDLFALETTVTGIQKANAIGDKTQDHVSSTNLLFTWNGGTLTLSWAVGYIKDKLGVNHPVPAGSKVLVASTNYWVAWNPFHAVMAFSSAGSNIFATNKNNLIVCSLYTGTAGNSGPAGGGGSEAGGSAPTGNRYKLF